MLRPNNPRHGKTAATPLMKTILHSSKIFKRFAVILALTGLACGEETVSSIIVSEKWIQKKTW